MKLKLMKSLLPCWMASALCFSSLALASEEAVKPSEAQPLPSAGVMQQAIDEAKQIDAEQPKGTKPAIEYPAVMSPSDTAAETADADTESAAVSEPSKAPITGAFGLTLGEPFADWMVAKVISQEETTTYRGKDEDRIAYPGTLYRVEPHIPNPLFNEYLVTTNQHGIIYSIRARQDTAEKASTCDLTREMGKYLIGKYGKPRGAGMLGEWYAFRDRLDGPYRGVRLFAQRCRNGRYEVHYSDEAALKQESAPQPVPEQMVGL
jgi:hypothetical protein